MTITLTDKYSWGIAHCTTPADISTALALPGSWAMGAQPQVWVRNDQWANLPSGATLPPVAGYAAWYDATRITGQADNTPLATWLDSSGNGHTFTQATPANQPIYYSSTPGKTVNGKPAVWFNNPTYMQAASLTQAQPFTICAVAQSNAVGTQALITDIATDWFFYAGGPGVTWVLYAGSYVTFQTFDAALHTVQGVFNGASSSFTVDSSTMAASGTIGSNPFGANGLFLGMLPGPTDYWVGPICELLIYPTALTAPQLTSTYNYLKTKWGTP